MRGVVWLYVRSLMKSLKLEPPKSRARLVCERLRDAIIDGGFALGSMIPEETLAQSFGVSRTPVREALNLLQIQGLVVIRPQVGSFVFSPSVADIEALCRFRMILEPRAAELAFAVEVGIYQVNVESEGELETLSKIAEQRGKRQAIVLRVNPEIGAGGHAKITTGGAANKFGVSWSEAERLYIRAANMPGIAIKGLAVHIGSQIFDFGALEAAFRRMRGLMEKLAAQGLPTSRLDLGGGVGVPYKAGEVFPQPAEYAAMIARVTEGWDATLMFEPGRLITGNTGVLLTEVVRVKQGALHPWVVVDAAMNDLARPAMYDAWHDFSAVAPKGETMTANIVGPICESSDTFAMAREIDVVARGDLAVFRTAGAYGATMANTYNSRPMVPEVMVDGAKWAVVADRIEPATILSAERVPEWLE